MLFDVAAAWVRRGLKGLAIATAAFPTRVETLATYLKIKGEWNYLYRAVDSTGQTIDFLLTAKRDAAAAKRFFRKAFQTPGNPSPRVVNVDKNPAYPIAIEELKAEGSLSPRCKLRQCRYLNNVVEQSHRNVKRRARLAMGYGSFHASFTD